MSEEQSRTHLRLVGAGETPASVSPGRREPAARSPEERLVAQQEKLTLQREVFSLRLSLDMERERALLYRVVVVLLGIGGVLLLRQALCWLELF